VTGRLAAFDVLVGVGVGVAVAAGVGDALAFALLGAEGCAVFVGAPVVQPDATRSNDASTNAGVACRIIFILNPCGIIFILNQCS
jgi:zinc transporter ZupT